MLTAARGLSREENEYEILNSRDLSKKGPPLGFHWHCFGEYLRADSEQQVENVVWRASSNANAEQPDP